MLENFMIAEIFYGSSDSKTSQFISKLLKEGKARKLAPKIYTTNFESTPEVLIEKNIFHIVEHFYPGSVLVHRSALEIRPRDGLLVLSGKKRAKIELPGVIIYFVDERGPTPKDTNFLGLYIAHEARAFLENLTQARPIDGHYKNLPREELEKRLLKKLEQVGESELNRLRDEAREYALKENMQKEFKELEQMIGAILGTKDVSKLRSDQAKFYTSGMHYDSDRIQLMTDFFSFLKDWPLNLDKDLKMEKPSHFRNKAFFESYFSNFIEGTEFEIEEAEEIIFDKKESSRPKDAHDILGTFEIVADAGEMRRTPSDENDFLSLLKERHEKMMEARLEIEPGQWKEKNNRAGNTYFVEPEKVEGTLARAFGIYQGLPSGFHRAAFMMVLITEVHPFRDGNGRLARIMMNAELESSDLGSIIIPNCYREDYLLSLKAISRRKRFDPFIRMLLRALKFSNAIDFSDYRNALNEVKKRNWFLLPSEGKIID